MSTAKSDQVWLLSRDMKLAQMCGNFDDCRQAFVPQQCLGVEGFAAAIEISSEFIRSLS